MATRYFRGQGKCYVGVRNAAGAVADGFRFCGNVPELQLRVEADEVEHQESFSGQQYTDLKFSIMPKAMGTIVFENFDKDSLEFLLRGTASSVTGATVTEESVTAVLGAYVPLSKINLTAFTSLTHTSGTPTYDNGDDYTIDLKSGMLYFPAGSAIADGATVKANYTFATNEKIVGLNQTDREFWFRFDGLNTVEGNTPVVIDVFRCQLRPQAEWALIQNNQEVAQLNQEFTALYDEDQADGPYFRVRMAVQA